MKIRKSFVTNSSSSSYTVLWEVDIQDMDAIKEMVKEEYGNQGIRKLNNNLIPGSEYKFPSYSIANTVIEISPDKFYVEATSWSGDSCYDDEGCDVIDMIPVEMKAHICEWEDDH